MPRDIRDFGNYGNIYEKHLVFFTALVSGFNEIAKNSTIPSFSVISQENGRARLSLLGVSYVLMHRFNCNAGAGTPGSTLTLYAVDDLDERKLSEHRKLSMDRNGNVADPKNGYNFNPQAEFEDIFLLLFADK